MKRLGIGIVFLLMSTTGRCDWLGSTNSIIAPMGNDHASIGVSHTAFRQPSDGAYKWDDGNVGVTLEGTTEWMYLDPPAKQDPPLWEDSYQIYKGNQSLQCDNQELLFWGWMHFHYLNGNDPDIIKSTYKDKTVILDDSFCQVPTPILIDINQDGIHLGARGILVNFDFFGFGFTINTQWVAGGGDEAFLALDLNSNGVVDDGSELFGSGTWLINQGTWATDGFVALAQYDDPSLGGNNDGV